MKNQPIYNADKDFIFSLIGAFIIIWLATDLPRAMLGIFIIALPLYWTYKSGRNAERTRIQLLLRAFMEEHHPEKKDSVESFINETADIDKVSENIIYSYDNKR